MDDRRYHNHRTSILRLLQGIVAVALVLVALHFLFVIATGDTTTSTTTPMPALDFVVAGFPKCGTTTLLYAFRQHDNQILMSSREVCTMKDKRRAESVVNLRYRRELQQAWYPDDNQAATVRKKGIKCPTILYSDKALDRLFSWYEYAPSSRNNQQHLRWIIGMRHPLRQVESYYNYLVTEVYDKGYWFYKGIRSLDSVVGHPNALPWKDMAHDSHRYEIHLKRLLSRLQRHEHAPSSVLVYSLEQLQAAEEEEDPNYDATSSSQQLRHDLGAFVSINNDGEVDLQIGHENRNHFTGARAHSETIDLCDAVWNTLRAKLLQESQVTAQWIEDYLLTTTSPYYDLIQVAGGVDALRVQVQTWKQDICA